MTIKQAISFAKNLRFIGKGSHFDNPASECEIACMILLSELEDQIRIKNEIRKELRYHEAKIGGYYFKRNR